ncbi:MAG TPA: divalent-cation tolerance protein CutA [Candidatus Binataceae bacterium]|nr:divalent-cation tolerance protein CutA [Candidatus Binataceae bacterium]
MKKRSQPNARVVMVTAPNQRDASAIARTLVDENLAACVNILGPIRSIYRWQNAIEDEAEFLLLIKTRSAICARLEQRVKELHSYDVPEVIALPIETGSAQYLAWLTEATTPMRTEKRRRTRAARS